MEPIMNLTHAISAAFLAGCLAVPSHSSFEALKVPSGSIPPATKDLTISTRSGEPLSLFDVLTAVSEASGVQIIADSEATIGLQESMSGFHGDFTIPAAEAWTVVEHAMIQGGFFLSALHMGETKLVSVHFSDERRGRYSWKYGSVGVENLDYVSLHPSFLFELNMELPKLETRTLSNHLRGFHRDHPRMEVVPVGSDALVLRGIGRDVDSLARMLLETNERAGERSEPDNKEQSQGATGG